MRAPLPAPSRLHIAAGALVLVAAAGLFGTIAAGIASVDALTRLDLSVAGWLHRQATPELTTWMRGVTNLSSTLAISGYGIIAAVILYQKQRWRALAALVVCLGGGMVLNVLMKLAFHRARPVFSDPLLTLTTYSFPSGHVAASTLFYGLGVAWVCAATRSIVWRSLAVLGALAMVALVALTRLYLGVHFLSDAVAAFAEGVAWLVLCFAALTAFWRRRRAAPGDPSHR